MVNMEELNPSEVMNNTDENKVVNLPQVLSEIEEYSRKHESEYAKHGATSSASGEAAKIKYSAYERNKR